MRNYKNEILCGIQIVCFVTLVCMVFISGKAKADCDKGYASVGAGYKYLETTKFSVNGKDYQMDNQSPYSARFEVGVECESFKFGISHRSQWLEGWPVNDHKEYSVNELFIEYKYTWDL